jgi:hypothetical protein
MVCIGILGIRKHVLIQVHVHIHRCNIVRVRRACADALNVNGRSIKSLNSPAFEGRELRMSIE